MLEFHETINPGRKTKVWRVYSTHNGSWLGQVRWFPQWRRYCFYPGATVVMDSACLTEAASFCATQTAKHKET